MSFSVLRRCRKQATENNNLGQATRNPQDRLHSQLQTSQACPWAAEPWDWVGHASSTGKNKIFRGLVKNMTLNSFGFFFEKMRNLNFCWTNKFQSWFFFEIFENFEFFFIWLFSKHVENQKLDLVHEIKRIGILIDEIVKEVSILLKISIRDSSF